MQAQDYRADILLPALSSRSVQTYRRLQSLHGCQISTTVRWRVTIHVALAAVRSVAVKRPSNDRERRPACRRRNSCQVQAPPTTCSTAVATFSTAGRITGRRQHHRHWNDLALTAGAATRYHAICSTSPGGGGEVTVVPRIRTDWKTG